MDVDGFAALYCGNGGTVAQVAGYDLQILDVLAQRLCQCVGYEPVGGAVEAVLPDAVVLVILVGQAEHICLFRHGLVEGSVEYDYLGHVGGHNLLACPQRQRMCVVMYGSQLLQIVDLLDDLISHQNRLVENLGALDDPVAYGGDLVHALDDGSVSLGQDIYQLHEGFCMGGEITVLI